MDAAAGERVEINRQVATSVLPSPVAISVILPRCWAMPPMSCTSNGTMSHFCGRPRTVISWPQQPAAGVFHDGERLRQNLIELLRELVLVLDFGKLLLPRGGFGAQFVVGKFLEAVFELVDLRDERLEPFHFAVVPRPENHFDQARS